MWSHRRSGRRHSDAETRLRAYRSEPRADFSRDLAGRLQDNPVRRPTAWSRLAFAGSVASLIVGMFATVGGFSYAAAGATSTYSVVKESVVDQKLTVEVDKSSAQEQYPGTPTPPEQPPQQNVAGENTNNAAVAGVEAADTLPFTGISLLATFLVGASLLVLGLILRRRERTSL
jgi:hypothetical protein